MTNSKILGKPDNIIKPTLFARIENLCRCLCFTCISELTFVLIEKWLYPFTQKASTKCMNPPRLNCFKFSKGNLR